MPKYDFKCQKCQKVCEKELALTESRTGLTCACGGPLDRIYTDFMFKPAAGMYRKVGHS